jgi:D-alanyl-lipoteichoic acid acyltransferase DltB (MBOAT superfamily)
MAFTSIAFLILTAAALAVYYRVPGRYQWPVLLAASIIFYCAGGWKTIVYVLYTAVTVYLSAEGLARLHKIRKNAPEQTKKQTAERCRRYSKLIVLAACLLNFGLLYVLKYWNFTAELLQPLADRVSSSAAIPMISLIMPLGVSFFMFQSVGYVIDVYRAKYEPEHNFLKFLLFVSFFPQMVQGPISRFDQLAPQLYSEKQLDYRNLRFGIQLMMWGYFKKMVIADRAAVLVNTVMEDPFSYSGSIQALGIFFYCIQLYGDFSGGIDITRGVAKMFGIDMAENFRRPLFATSLTDFWRRWHITLGAWMRDYLFYPLALSRPFGKLGKFTRKHIKGKLGKIIPTSLATFIIYFVIGIWHGANFKYIAFGFWNGAIITASLLLAPQFEKVKKALHIDDKAAWFKVFQTARTCVLVFIGRYITRASGFMTAVYMIKATFTDTHISDLFNGTVMTLGIGAYDMAVIILGMAVLIAVEWYQERGGHIREALEKQGTAVQLMSAVVPVIILLVLGIMRSDYISSDFIYKQF